MAHAATENRRSVDSPIHAATSRQVQLAQALREAATLPAIDGEAVAWLEQKLTDQTFNLVVAGQFKRGKSSVINSLLGDRLLPVGVIPLTSVVTLI
jgi:ribosome biogenesis GTPase A